MEKSDKMTFEFGKKSSAQGPCSKDIDYMDYYWLLCILGSSASIVLACYVMLPTRVVCLKYTPSGKLT